MSCARLPAPPLPPCSEGKTSWEELDLDDVDVRLKWAGLFHRRKRTPGRFMMRLKVGRGRGAAGRCSASARASEASIRRQAGRKCAHPTGFQPALQGRLHAWLLKKPKWLSGHCAPQLEHSRLPPPPRCPMAS